MTFTIGRKGLFKQDTYLNLSQVPLFTQLSLLSSKVETRFLTTYNRAPYLAMIRYGLPRFPWGLAEVLRTKHKGFAINYDALGLYTCYNVHLPRIFSVHYYG